MKNWLSHLFSSSKPAGVEATTAPELLSLQNELQTLRLELDSRDQAVAALKQEIERQRTRQDELVGEIVASQMEDLFADLAAPASQILTQADLLEKQNKPLQASNILPVARRMVRALERHGLAFEGQPGQGAVYDPNRHTPINTARSLQPGEPVTVRFAGAAFRSKIIYKAVVE